MTRGSRRSLIHPVNALRLSHLARVFLEALQVLDLALFIALATELVDSFAFLEGLLLLGPDALLVAEERGMP